MIGSNLLRSLIVQSLIGGGRGHMGSAMSLVEILRVIYDKVANISPRLINNPDRDRIILKRTWMFSALCNTCR